MAIDAVTVHNSDHPHAMHTTQVFLDAVTVLVHFPHLRNEACARLHTHLFDEVDTSIPIARRLLPSPQHAHLSFLVVLDAVIRALSPDVDPSEVCAILHVVHIGIWAYLHQITGAQRGRRSTVRELLLLLL